MQPKLMDVWSTICRTLKEFPLLDESNTKMRVITPLLHGLGWDIYGGDVQTEYEIQYGSGRVKVDYALFSDDKPRIFVEAKSLRIELGDVHAGQVISYAKSRDVGWCALTNGRQIRIYNASWGTEPANTLFEIIDLDPDKDPPKRLRLLSKDAVASGQLDRLGQRSRFSQTIRARLSSMLSELRGRWMNEAGNKVYTAVRDELAGVTRKHVKDQVTPLIRIEIVEPTGKDELHRLGDEKEPEIRRGSIADLPNGLVALCPSRKQGVDWMKRHNAWGFIRISRNPDYFALYVSEDIREVRYLARVHQVADPGHNDSPALEVYRQSSYYTPGKKIILFQEGSLIRLDSSIPLGKNPRRAPQSLRYCWLDDLRKARTLDDI